MKNLLNRYHGLSDPLKTQRRVELVLVVLALLFLCQLLLGTLSSVLPSAPSPISPAEDSLSVTSGAGPMIVDAAQREEIAQRPLFWEERRALQSVPADGQEDGSAPQELKPGKIDGIQLAGIFGAGESTGIIVIAKGKKHRITTGEEVNGWTLTSAKPTEAVFSRRGKQATLSLKRSSIEVTGGAEHTGQKTGPLAELPAEPATEQSSGKSTERSAMPQPPPPGDSLRLGGGDR